MKNEIQNNNRNKKNKKAGIFSSLAVILLLIIGALLGNPQEDIENHNNAIETESETETVATSNSQLLYEFRKDSYLMEHFEKHGDEFDYETAEEYEVGANRVIASENALTKTEAEDGDFIYYLEETNEFVIVSTDGYIRTYFRPSDGIDYYNRQ